MRLLALSAILIASAIVSGCASHGSADYGITNAVYSENPVYFEAQLAPASAPLAAPERSDEPIAWPSENPVFDSRFAPPSTGAAPEMTPSPEFFADRPGYSGN